jgi:subtilisin-like proprotein convertase family protein
MLTSSFFRRTAMTSVRLLLAGLLLTAWAALPRSTYSAPAATVWYVGGPGGSDTYPCTTAAKPCEHIQAAIDKAASSGTVNIAAGTYYETLEISNKGLTMQGKGAAATIIDGQLQGTVLSIFAAGGVPRSIRVSGVTVRGGQLIGLGGGIAASDPAILLTVTDSNIISNTASYGGGIFNQGVLTLRNVTIRDNRASALDGEGGGIWNTRFAALSGVTIINNRAPRGGGISNINTLTVTDSLISDNRAIGNFGGGIFNRSTDSRLTLVNTVVSGNQAVGSYGGGIYNEGTVIYSGSSVAGNLAYRGGGVYNYAAGQATFNSATLLHNTALDGGGGMYNETGGRLTVGTSNIISNTASAQQGGGISNLGTLTVTQSALVFNTSSAMQGGGLHNAGTARLTNVTVSDNTAVAGGGINNSGGTLMLQFSTISENSSPALNNASGSVTVGNSLLAQSAGKTCGGTIVSGGYNMDTGTSCGFSAAGDLSGKDPQLGPLQDNGGGTLTRVIAFSSLAVDSAGACPPPNTDQRGVARPQAIQLQQPKCDRGAYEVVGYANFNPLSIGSGLCVTRTMTINEKFAIGRILAGVNLTYTNRSDLTVRLLSPGTPKVTLLGPAANSGQNLNTMFDDSKSQFVPTGDQVTSLSFSNYVYKPATPLSQVRGMGIRGTWKLEICNAGTATGTLNYWVLVVPETTDFKVYLPIIKRN